MPIVLDRKFRRKFTRRLQRASERRQRRRQIAPSAAAAGESREPSVWLDDSTRRADAVASAAYRRSVLPKLGSSTLDQLERPLS